MAQLGSRLVSHQYATTGESASHFIDAGVVHRDIKPDPASPSAVGAVIASYRRCLVGNPRARFFDLPLAESPLSSLALCSKLESSAYRM